MTRNFRGKARNAVYLAADGKSDMSGRDLGSCFHADHIVPFAAGGATDVANGQALTPRENLMKGSRHVPQRAWQKEFIRKWTGTTADFLLSALPGAGKTIAALLAAKQFREEYPAGKIVVVVPSINLRDQWTSEAWHGFDISLQSKEFRGSLKSDHDGAVATYQTVAGDKMVFRAVVSRQPTLVIFDEVHHAGDERSWGEAIKFAFENGTRRLCLSGTPFRTDGSPVPFLRYDADGYCIPDMLYDYPTAVKDGVVRVVSFHHNAGEVEYLLNGDRVVGAVNQDVPEEEAKQHLRKLLAYEGDFARTLLAKAHEKLIEVRRFTPNAGGLVLCVDSAHALGIAGLLQSITGQRPDVVLSDDDKANSSVGSYRDSGRPWIVAVRQVSEGVDIKRLMILCYLTNTVTELFFRQAIGRIVRNMGTEFDGEAYCYLPDDPRLIGMAKRIIESQMVALREMEDEAEDRERDDRDTTDGPTVTVLGTSEAVSRGVIIAGTAYSTGEAELICAAAKDAGISQEKAAITLRAFMRLGVVPGHRQHAPETTRAPSVPPEQLADELRGTIKAKVNRLAKLTDRPHKVIHSDYMQRVSRPQREMTIQQLRDKIQWLDAGIREAKR